MMTFSCHHIRIHAFSTMGYPFGILWLKFYTNSLSPMGKHAQAFHLNGLPRIHLDLPNYPQAHFATDSPNCCLVVKAQTVCCNNDSIK